MSKCLWGRVSEKQILVIFITMGMWKLLSYVLVLFFASLKDGQVEWRWKLQQYSKGVKQLRMFKGDLPHSSTG